MPEILFSMSGRIPKQYTPIRNVQILKLDRRTNH